MAFLVVEFRPASAMQSNIALRCWRHVGGKVYGLYDLRSTQHHPGSRDRYSIADLGAPYPSTALG